MKVAGIAAGICATVMPMTAAAQGVKSDSTANRPVNTAKKGDVKVVDLSDGCVITCGCTWNGHRRRR